MGDLSKLKIAIAQPELIEGRPAYNKAVQDEMISKAVDGGADILLIPRSFTEEGDVHLIALNDSRIDVAKGLVVLEAAGETYRIAIGPEAERSAYENCDFSVHLDTTPWTYKQFSPKVCPGIVLRPVGMRNFNSKVLTYDGGTAAYDLDGNVIARLNDDFDPDFAIISMAEQNSQANPCQDKLLTCLVKTLRRFDRDVLLGHQPWIIGLSGGLDSSIVATLLVLAFGADRVFAYGLEGPFTSDATKANAKALAAALGINLRNGSIEELVSATANTAKAYGFKETALGGVVYENIQARIRGHLLSTFAAIDGGVVVNNGNRIEAALGYATLYGDAIGAIAPIGDLSKVRLFDLARGINDSTQAAIIPEALLPKETPEGFNWEVMPTAELSKGQRDPMKWFYHDWLIDYLLDSPSVEDAACEAMEGFLSGELFDHGLAKWLKFYKLDNGKAFAEDLQWVLNAMNSSAYKRIQGPPVIAVASPKSLEDTPIIQGKLEFTPRFQQLISQLKAL